MLLNLQTLDLYQNQLSSVPESLGKLAAIEELQLFDNRLSNVTPRIGDLTSLKILALEKNELGTVPDTLGNLKVLERLELWQNQLASVPAPLIALCEHGRLILYLHQNRALGVPPEILGPSHVDVYANGARPQNPKRLGRYLRLIEGGNVPRLNEAKLLVVGPGGAGKTSIIEQLLEGTFTPDTKISTHGVVVSCWDELRSDRDEPIRLNVWDFGGQEIQHSTHEFFLTERAVYLLVVNPRQDQRVQDEIYHWLDLIRMNAPDAPVIVALSQQDKFEGHVRDADSLDVVDFVQVSCEKSHATHDNFPHLKELIEREVRKLEREVTKLKGEKHEGKDEVLALLEDAR